MSSQATNTTTTNNTAANPLLSSPTASTRASVISSEIASNSTDISSILSDCEPLKVAYFHRQRSCLPEYYLFIAVISVFALLSCFIIAGLTHQWSIFASYSGCFVGIFLFICNAEIYKYLTIRDDQINENEEELLHIGWNRIDTIYTVWSISIKYKDIAWFKHTKSNKGCNPYGEAICGQKLIFNANGCGTACVCCKCFCDGNPMICSNLDMMEIGLKNDVNYIFNCCHVTRYNPCYSKYCDKRYKVLRVSTDDYHNLAQYLISKGIKSYDHDNGDNISNSVLLKIGKNNSIQSPDPIGYQCMVTSVEDV